jgi:hypothetical protein
MHYFEKTIVFGHTPFEDVLFHLPYKVGIDTGLVYGSMLSCVEIRDERVYQIELKEKTVKEYSFADKGGDWPQFHQKGKSEAAKLAQEKLAERKRAEKESEGEGEEAPEPLVEEGVKVEST